MIISILLALSLSVQSQDTTKGFVAIFDGKTLTNWDGDPRIWRAEDGVLIGETTPEKRITVNTFLIWRGGTTKDFELKLDYRLSAGANSGVQYRSSVVANVGQWTMRGYQADLDAADQYSGQVYEERGRAFLARRGQFTRIRGAAGGGTEVLGSLGTDTELKAFLKPNDWNSLHIIVRGNSITQIINGHVMSALIDEDEQGRAMEGLLGLQMHTGPPMRIEFRNVRVRTRVE
jgi:hypothetical protein